MKILITRPEPDASRLAAILSAKGYTPRLAPMMFIEILPGREVATDGAQALLVTSANGARALARLDIPRDLRCYAVGRATAEALTEAGFTDVKAAGGDVHSLHDLIVASAAKEGGRLIHVSGSEVAGDLVGMLKASGFECERVVLYEALPVTSLDPNIVREIRAGEIAAVLFYSPRTATLFAERVTAAGLVPQMAAITAYCLSAAIAGKLSELPFREVKIAAEPDQEKLLALLPPLGQAEQKDDTADRSRERKMSDRKDGKTEKARATDPAAGAEKAGTKPGAVPEAAPEKAPDKAPGDGLKATREEKGEQSAPVAGTGSDAAPNRSRAGWILAALVIVFALGLALWPILYPIVSPYLPERAAAIIDGRFARPALTESAAPDLTPAIDALRDELKSGYAALESRLAALEAEVKTLPAAPVGAGDAAPQAALDALKEQLSAEIASLTDRLAAEEQALASLRDQISGQDARLDALASAPLAVAAPSPEIQGEIVDLKSGLLDLKTALDDVRSTINAEREAVAAQAGRIAALESAVQSEADARAARADEARRTLLLLAVGQLQRETRGNAPFDGALRQVASVADGRFGELISPLEPIAPGGAPTLATLRDDFARIAGDITQAARLPVDESWYNKALHRIASLVKLRRVDGTDSDDVDALVARAEQKLADNDLAGAVAEVERLDGAPAATAAAWLEQAKRRLAVEASIAGLLEVAAARTAE